MLLNVKLAQEFRPFDPVVGTDSWRHGDNFAWRLHGFNSATILTGFSGALASNQLQIRPRSHHDRATITPRSGHDRVLIVIMELGRPPSGPVGAIPRRKMCDHGSIMPRSWVFPRLVCTVRWRFL